MSNDPPELGALIPGLTRSSIIDDERAALCPGCGHQTKPAEPGPLACDGCGNVYLVAP